MFRDLGAEVLEEFAEASGRGREWFGGEAGGYDTRKLQPLPDEGYTILVRKLAKKAGFARWRATHLEEARTHSQEWARAHPERSRELARIRSRRPHVRARQRVTAKALYQLKASTSPEFVESKRQAGAKRRALLALDPAWPAKRRAQAAAQRARDRAKRPPPPDGVCRWCRAKLKRKRKSGRPPTFCSRAHSILFFNHRRDRATCR